LRRLSTVLLVPALALTACSAASEPAGVPSAASASPSPEIEAAGARLRVPPASTVVPGTTALEMATATSTALFASAPVVVLAGDGDLPSQGRAASVAVALGAPLLLAPAAPASAPVVAEVARLAPQVVLAVGTAAATWADALDAVDVVRASGDDARLAELTGRDLGPSTPATEAEVLRAVAALDREGDLPLVAVGPADAGRGDVEGLPDVPATGSADGTVVLTTDDPARTAAVATARAAGAEVVVVPGHDPRAYREVIARLAELGPDRVLGLGSSFGDPGQFATRVETAATGVELPGGGQLVLAGKRYVALYGHPGSDRLGVLGEQGPEASVGRAVDVAAQYAAIDTGTQVVPTFEVITTIADAVPGDDGDYSAESTIDHLRPYVDAAARNGVYVVLDLQPGYADFLSQAERYEELLALPHVGLALDPEWRLAPGQRHLRQVGRVSAAEVNAVGDWLAALVRDRRLPQKMLLLHQFKTYMLEDREQMIADRDELAVVTQMDGHGPTGSKLETWSVILRDPPPGMVFGWKNFYDEDSPTMSPARTLAVEPTPVFISYQ